MRKLICGLLSLFIIHSSEAQGSFDTSGHTLNISEGKVQRLTDGVGLIDTRQTGSKKVLVNGKEQTFSYIDNMLTVDIPVASKPTVTISW